MTAQHLDETVAGVRHWLHLTNYSRPKPGLSLIRRDCRHTARGVCRTGPRSTPHARPAPEKLQERMTVMRIHPCCTSSSTPAYALSSASSAGAVPTCFSKYEWLARQRRSRPAEPIGLPTNSWNGTSLAVRNPCGYATAAGFSSYRRSRTAY